MEEQLKKLLKGIVKSKMFIIVAISILAVFLISLLYYYLTVFVDGSFNEDDWGSTTYVASKYTGQAKITGNGIQTQNTAQELWDKMIQEGNNVNDYLDSPQELEKLMNAEIITQYPKIGSGNIDGIIQFKRHKEDGSTKLLQYIDKQTFDNYESSNDKRILDYFTLDESGNVLVGIVDEEIYKLTSDDDKITLENLKNEGMDVIPLEESDKTIFGDYNKKVIKVRTMPINYKSIVEKYTLPFQYLWALLVTGEDKYFVLELADLAYNSEIVFSIYDNITTYVEDNEYTYKKETRTDKYVKLKVKNDYGAKGYKKERYWLSEDSPEEYQKHYDSDYLAKSEKSKEYKVNYKKTYITNLPVCDLEKADVWLYYYSKSYEYQNNNDIDINENTTHLEDTEYIYNKETSQTSKDNILLIADEDANKFKNEVKDYIENYIEDYLQKDLEDLEDLLESNTTINTITRFCNLGCFFTKWLCFRYAIYI